MDAQPSRLSIAGSATDRHLSATGVIDSHTAGELLDGLRQLGTDGDVRLDLTEVEFIDSSGIRCLVTSHKELEEAEQRLVLTGMSDAVRRLLEITGLEEHLHQQ